MRLAGMGAYDEPIMLTDEASKKFADVHKSEVLNYLDSAVLKNKLTEVCLQKEEYNDLFKNSVEVPIT